MYSSPSAPSMELRIVRMITPEKPAARASAGRMRCSVTLPNAAHWPFSRVSISGNPVIDGPVATLTLTSPVSGRMPSR